MKTLPCFVIAIITICMAGCSGKPASDDATKALKDLKVKPVYKQLTKEIIDGLKNDELEQAVFDNIESGLHEDGKDIAEKISALTPGQRAIYVTWIVEAEVEGSGLVGFYGNSGKTLSRYVVESFQTIGATQFADLMQQANAIYAQQTSAKGDPYEKLEDQFESLYETESLDALKVGYIRDHPTEFVNREKSLSVIR